MTNYDFAMLAAKTLSEKKAIDVKIIDIMSRASFADYLVIASGNSERQVSNLTEYVEDALAQAGLFTKSVEGRQSSNWVLMDCGDVIVNIFTPEARDKYNIEKVWGDCPCESIE